MGVTAFIRFGNIVLLATLVGGLKKFYGLALQYQTYRFKQYFLVPTRIELWLMRGAVFSVCFTICFLFAAKDILLFREYMIFAQLIFVCAINIIALDSTVMPLFRAGKSEFKIIYSRNILKGKYYNKGGELLF